MQIQSSAAGLSRNCVSNIVLKDVDVLLRIVFAFLSGSILHDNLLRNWSYFYVSN